MGWRGEGYVTGGVLTHTGRGVMSDATTTSSDGGLKEEAKQQTQEVTATAKEKVVDLTHEAGEQARHLIDEARWATRQRLEEQGDQVSQAARQWANDLRQMAEASQDNPMASLAREGAGRIDQFVSRYEQAGLDGLTDDLTQFARRRPLLFLGGTFAIGAVAARLFRHADTGPLKGAVADRTQEQGPESRQASQSPTSGAGKNPGDSNEATSVQPSPKQAQPSPTGRSDV